MVLIWPGSLFGLIPAAAVAAWALFRPSRRLAVVGSLSLWREALAALDRSARRPARRITASWALLLAGAAAAVLGLARPVVHTEGLARRVSVAVYPSAELAGPAGPAALKDAVGALLDRLDSRDRVQWLRPVLLGGRGGDLTIQEARRELDALQLLPVPAREMLLPDASAESRHTYRFVPAGTDVPAGARVSIIELPVSLPAVTVDAVGAAEVGQGKVQLLVSLRSRARSPWAGRVNVLAPRADDEAAAPWRVLGRSDVTVAPGARRDVILSLPSCAAMTVSVEGPDGEQVAAAYLARAAGQKRKIALLGRDEPVLRRYVEADDALEPVGSAAQADVVIANGVRPPAGKPSLVIDPPGAPPGWRRATQLADVVLNEADVAAADPLLRGVNLEAVAVRRVRPWVQTAGSAQKVLVSLGGEAIVLRDLAAGPAASDARRVYVAFELSSDNTNLAMSEAFVVLLANAVRWLAPVGKARPGYEYLHPGQVPGPLKWDRLAGPAPGREQSARLLWPGIFRDEAGALQAVSLVGLAGGRPAGPPREAVAAAPLPAPEPLGRQVELWALLAVAAVALWLAGWALRIR